MDANQRIVHLIGLKAVSASIDLSHYRSWSNLSFRNLFGELEPFKLQIGRRVSSPFLSWILISFRGDNIFVGLWDLSKGLNVTGTFEELPHVMKAN